MNVPSFVFEFEDVNEDIIIDLLSNLDTGKKTGIDRIGASHLNSAEN